MNDLLIKPKDSIKNALKKITKTSQKCLMVVDEENCLIGTLSEGDIRKAILSRVDIRSSINNYYNEKPTFFYENQYSDKQIEKIFLKEKFDLIPIVDQKKVVKNYLTWNNIFTKNEKIKTESINIPVVIMAGGKGTRLQPFTKVLPKPLIPIKDKSIIEIIIGEFQKSGCDHFHMTLNYKSEIIKAYFNQLNSTFKVDFIDEKKPLGTAGSLKLLSGTLNEPFFVTNCDIIAKINYAKLFDFHRKNDFDITLVASAKEYEIPYGTCELNNHGYLSAINEKPKYNLLINTGLYVINPDILDLIPDNNIFHMTHLIQKAKDLQKKVGVFPIDDESWIDIGQWSEYHRVLDQL